MAAASYGDRDASLNGSRIRIRAGSSELRRPRIHDESEHQDKNTRYALLRLVVEPWRKHLATLLGWASNLISMRRHRCWLAALLVADEACCLEPAAAVRPLLAFLEAGKGEEKGGRGATHGGDR